MLSTYFVFQHFVTSFLTLLGKSVIPNTEELSVSEIAEMLFHPQLTNLKRLAIHEWPMDVTQ